MQFCSGERETPRLISALTLWRAIYQALSSGTTGPSFRRRNSPRRWSNRTYLDIITATETGFYSPSLFTTAPTLGLADFGTRIHISFGTIQAGTHLFVPTTITLTGNYGEGSFVGQLQLVEADSNGKSAAGYEPVPATAMVEGTPVARASVSGSTAYATYEVIYADPSVQETAIIPVAVAFTNKPATGDVSATTSLAPLGVVTTASETAPIPRFANFASPQLAYSITSCSAQAAGK